MEALLLFLLVAVLIFSIRFPWWKSAVDYDQPRILMYHMIANRSKAEQLPNLAVSPGKFKWHLWWLRINGWTFATLADVLESQHPRKTVVLTFDDGYLDNLTHALPLLVANNAKATVFLIGDRADIHEGGASDGTPLAPMMTDADVRKLISFGCIELGGHTLNHSNLTMLSREEQRWQIAAGRQRLVDTFNVPVTTFAYPLGEYDAESVEEVQKIGFSAAVTTKKGVSDLEDERFELRRVKISGRDNFLSFPIQMRIGRKR